MPTQKNDRSRQWTLDQGDSRSTLARTATITVSEGYGIYESTSNNSIIVLGDINWKGSPRRESGSWDRH